MREFLILILAAMVAAKPTSEHFNDETPTQNVLRKPLLEVDYISYMDEVLNFMNEDLLSQEKLDVDGASGHFDVVQLDNSTIGVDWVVSGGSLTQQSNVTRIIHVVDLYDNSSGSFKLVTYIAISKLLLKYSCSYKVRGVTYYTNIEATLSNDKMEFGMEYYKSYDAFYFLRSKIYLWSDLLLWKYTLSPGVESQVANPLVQAAVSSFTDGSGWTTFISRIEKSAEDAYPLVGDPDH